MKQPYPSPQSFGTVFQFSAGPPTRSISRCSSTSPGSRIWPDGRCRRMNIRLFVLLTLGLALALVGCSTSGGKDSWPGPTRPYQGKLHIIPGTIELEDFDEGDEGVAYHDLEAENL